MITDRIEKNPSELYQQQAAEFPVSVPAIWTESYQSTEGKPRLHPGPRRLFTIAVTVSSVHIFEGELVVGAIGEFRKCGILTPEFFLAVGGPGDGPTLPPGPPGPPM